MLETDCYAVDFLTSLIEREPIKHESQCPLGTVAIACISVYITEGNEDRPGRGIGGWFAGQASEPSSTLYNFDKITADTSASRIATIGLKEVASTPNSVTKAPIRRCKAAELVIFGLDIPNPPITLRKSLDAVGTSAFRRKGI